MKDVAHSKKNYEIAVIQKDIRDAMAVKKINFSCHGQLKFVLQYIHHYLYFKKHRDAEREKLMLGIILSGMSNIEKLEELMASLGVNPVFIKATFSGDCIYKTSVKHTAEKMLLDDITAKMITLRLLKAVEKKVVDDKAKKIIYSIVSEEENYLKALESSFKKLRGENCAKTVGLPV